MGSFFLKKVASLRGLRDQRESEEKEERRRKLEKIERKEEEIKEIRQSIRLRLATIVSPKSPEIYEEVFKVFDNIDYGHGPIIFTSEDKVGIGNFIFSLNKIPEIFYNHRTIGLDITCDPQNEWGEIILIRGDEIIKYLQGINQDDKLIEILAHVIVKYSRE